jgi:nickel-dependent lactate racemase
MRKDGDCFAPLAMTGERGDGGVVADIVQIEFQCKGIPPLEVPRAWLLGVVRPNQGMDAPEPAAVIQDGLAQPIGGPRLRELASGERSVLILVDDNTRLTPTRAILPLLLEELAAGGLRGEAIRFMVAAGTHRPMTETEKTGKYGPDICRNYEILDHRWDDEGTLVSIDAPVTGIPIRVNRAVLEAGLLIGVGHIVPHPVAGFSGGGKIVQPGVCGAATTAETHWHATRYPMEEIMGVADNPVRLQMEAVARAAGLDAIVNAVQDAAGRLVRVVAGDIVQAHRAGTGLARQLYGAQLPGVADIAVVDAYPNDQDMWQADKAIGVGGMAVRRGGVIVVVAACPDGISPEHPELLEYGFRPYAEIQQLAASGQMRDQVAASELAYTGRIAAEQARCILVSPGITREEARQLGCLWTATPQAALEMAHSLLGQEAPRVTVVHHGGEILPLRDW